MHFHRQHFKINVDAHFYVNLFKRFRTKKKKRRNRIRHRNLVDQLNCELIKSKWSRGFYIDFDIVLSIESI